VGKEEADGRVQPKGSEMFSQRGGGGGAGLATSSIPENWRPFELLVLLKQLDHGLAYFQKSINKSSIISSQCKKTLNIPALAPFVSARSRFKGPD
jgi:hypothetical protein